MCYLDIVWEAKMKKARSLSLEALMPLMVLRKPSWAVCSRETVALNSCYWDCISQGSPNTYERKIK